MKSLSEETPFRLSEVITKEKFDSFSDEQKAEIVIAAQFFGKDAAELTVKKLSQVIAPESAS